MYNVNPDITVNNPQGGLWHMPGLLAKRYEAMGGRVTYFGKPHKVSVTSALPLAVAVISPQTLDSTVLPPPSPRLLTPLCARRLLPSVPVCCRWWPDSDRGVGCQEHYETAVEKMGLGKDRVVHVRPNCCCVVVSGHVSLRVSSKVFQTFYCFNRVILYASNTFRIAFNSRGLVHPP